ERMARLKEMMLPYIAEKCASWVPYQEDKDLKAYFEKHVLPAQADFAAKKVPALERALFAYQPRGGFVHPVRGAGRGSRPEAKNPGVKEAVLRRDFSLADRQPKRRSTEGPYFGKPAKIF